MHKEGSNSNVRMIGVAPAMVETSLMSHTSDPKIVKEKQKAIPEVVDYGPKPN